MPSIWIDEWNDVIRNVFFQDLELKKLMLLPEGTDIISFIDKYFIRAGFSNTLVENEDVRIIYGTTGNDDTSVPQVKRNVMNFDIYVKTKHLHNVDDDRLKFRTEVIAERILYLLTKNRYVKDTGYRFWIKTCGELGTRTVGYSRYGISFYYMRVY